MTIMPDSKRLRVGVIGCGGIAQMMHLPNLRSLPDLFEITAISDLSPGILGMVGELYGIPESQRFTDYRELLTEAIDAVLILHSGNHAPQVLDAIHAGKHVLVEKPLCYTLREADAIMDAASTANVRLMVGYMKRYDPGYRYAQERLREMSDIRFVQINTLHPAEDDYRAIYNIAHVDDVPSSIMQPLAEARDRQAIEAVGQVSPLLRQLYTDRKSVV